MESPKTLRTPGADSSVESSLPFWLLPLPFCLRFKLRLLSSIIVSDFGLCLFFCVLLGGRIFLCSCPGPGAFRLKRGVCGLSNNPVTPFEPSTGFCPLVFRWVFEKLLLLLLLLLRLMASLLEWVSERGESKPLDRWSCVEGKDWEKGRVNSLVLTPKNLLSILCRAESVRAGRAPFWFAMSWSWGTLRTNRTLRLLSTAMSNGHSSSDRRISSERTRGKGILIISNKTKKN